MGRTYRGLSRKEREEIRRARDARRYKHSYEDEDENNGEDGGDEDNEESGRPAYRKKDRNRE